METLKTKILFLKSQGIPQSQIAKQLNCSSGTVSYHCNPKVKEKIINKKRIHRKTSQSSIIHPYLNSELTIVPKTVCWKHAEAMATARLIEKGYEIFTPFNGGGEIDLIAIKNNDVFKVQVKSVSPKSKNLIKVDLKRNSINYKKHKVFPYKNIDFFLIYDGYNIYKIDEKIDQITLRYRVPNNNQITGVKMASDYIF